MNQQKSQEKLSTWDQATEDALVYSTVTEFLETINQLDTKMRAKCVEKFSQIELGVSNITALEIVSSIKETLIVRRSKKVEEETTRSTIISAVCGPQVTLKKVSSAFGIYQNNHHKLLKYRKRRDAYISGETDNMSGDRYASDKYGFPKEVLEIVDEFFKSDQCGTPDK